MLRLSFAIAAALIAAGPSQSISTRSDPTRVVAVTFDDLPFVSALPQALAEKERVTRDLLAALRRHRVPAIGFVNENKLADGESADPALVGLLRAWLAAGLELGNHSFSHPSLHRTPLGEYEADVLRGEAVLRPLLSGAGRSLRFFRHPFLHTGLDLETRRAFERFLGDHGYRVAPVTFDNSDYVFAAAFDRIRARGETVQADSVAGEYVEYMERVVGYYEAQSVALLGREPRQILLLHANALNAATFDRLAAMLSRRGYSFVSLDSALTDSAYRRPDTYVGSGGITWIHRWALTEGKRGAFFAGEPTVPAWIERAAAP